MVFPFSELFADDLSQGELIYLLFVAGSQLESYERKGDLPWVPSILQVCSTGLSFTYDDQMDIMEQVTSYSQQTFGWEFSFDKTFWSHGVANTASH